MTRHVSVVSLVDAKQAEEVVWAILSGGTAFALPEQGGEVVSLAEECTFSDVEGLGNGLQV